MFILYYQASGCYELFAVYIVSVSGGDHLCQYAVYPVQSKLEKFDSWVKPEEFR